MEITNNQQLLSWIGRNKRPKYLFFWGHKKPASGVDQSCFSQWFAAGFSEGDIRYKTAEHFMMAEKARLFNSPRLTDILAAHSPAEAKKLGRLVEHFDNGIWEQHRFDIVVRANMLKFSQNPALREYLLATGKRVLVEASPVDKIWGIGLAADHRNARVPSKWRGLNLLGYALMQVRAELAQGEC